MKIITKLGILLEALTDQYWDYGDYLKGSCLLSYLLAPITTFIFYICGMTSGASTIIGGIISWIMFTGLMWLCWIGVALILFGIFHVIPVLISFINDVKEMIKSVKEDYKRIKKERNI